MSACLSAKVPYAIQATVQRAYLQEAFASGPPSTRSGSLTQLPAESQIFMEETAMSLQAQAAHDSKYGPYNATNELDYLVGWLDHCVYDAGLEQNFTYYTPQVPPAAYANFLGVPLTDPRIDMFSSGYFQNPLPPLQLMPSGAPLPGVH
jgi:hypothetical protein